MNQQTNSLRGIEQGRAMHAFNAVSDIANEPSISDGNKKKYKSGAKKLPVLIKTNGLGQTLAFIEKRDGYSELFDQIEEWLKKKQLITTNQMVSEVIGFDSDKYRQVATETIALLIWMRRFVDSMIEGEVTDV